MEKAKGGKCLEDKMGGYLLLNIEFPNRKERDKFEKQEKMRRMFQYNDLIEDSAGGVKGFYDCFHYPTFMGYAEPYEILQRCRKNKIKIKKFLSIDLSTNGSWWNVIKEASFEDEE